MIPNPLLILAVVVAFVLNGFYWHANGVNAENTRWKAKTFEQIAQASEAARKQESVWQGVVNETAKNYQTREAGIRRNLDIALDGLRDRPERPASVGEGSRDNCKGSSGAELSRSDAGFLEREASRADSIRGGLEDCYKVMDALK